MAHVLFENTTATFALDPALDADATATFAVEPTDGNATEQTPALTLEQTMFDEPLPLPPPFAGDPAYLVEVRPPHGTPRLLAVRDTLGDAVHLAGSVHPSVADVVIREIALPCNVESLSLAGHRSWAREPSGAWTPELPERS